MFDGKMQNVKIFEDTMNWIEEDAELKAALAASKNSQKLYLEGEPIAPLEGAPKMCSTIISKKRSFAAAADYARKGKKVCVLNFASATNPGGGVTRGSFAQEECLCRCSTLYPCLNMRELQTNFYAAHRRAGNPLYNDDCIYTPGVLVCKRDGSYPERKEDKDWYQVDVLTCAAPNLRAMPGNPPALDAVCMEEKKLLALHQKRIERIFEVAASNHAEVLILGAFGCGAFENPAKVVAKAFCEVQKRYEQYFETIEYAIYCRDYETQNYEAFCEEFCLEE